MDPLTINAGIAGVSLVAGLVGGRKAKKQAAAEAERQRRAIAVEADRAEDVLLAETEAINDQRAFVQERMLLAEQAEQQAEAQANVEDPEVLLSGEATLSTTERRKRRSRFYSDPEVML